MLTRKDVKKIRLVASDLDGTLLQNGAQKLPPETCPLIHRLTQKGILFMAASGRQVDNLERLFDPVKSEISYLCENGCLGFFEGEMLFRAEMEESLGKEIIRTILERENSEVLLSGCHTSYIQPRIPLRADGSPFETDEWNLYLSFYYHQMHDVVRNNVTVVPDILNTPEPYFKISVYEPGGITDEDFYRERFSDRSTVVTSGNEWLDMMPKGVQKGTGLQRMLDVLGIAPEECMVFGDNYNDLEMMTMAGIPVAVENAKDEIKKVSRFTTPRVERVLEELLELL